MNRLLILLIFLSTFAYGQTKVPFAMTIPVQSNYYAYTNNGLWFANKLLAPYYAATGDTTLIGIDATGYGYKITKTMIQSWAGSSAGYIQWSDTARNRYIPTYKYTDSTFTVDLAWDPANHSVRSKNRKGATIDTEWFTGIADSVAFKDSVSALRALISAGSYTFSTGLTNTANTITNNLSTGVSGGQSVIGGTASGNNLLLRTTTNATKGLIQIEGATSGFPAFTTNGGNTLRVVKADNSGYAPIDVNAVLLNGSAAITQNSPNLEIYGDATLNATATATGMQLAGVPTAPTAAPGTNTTQLATTEFVIDATALTLDDVLNNGNSSGVSITITDGVNDQVQYTQAGLAVIVGAVTRAAVTSDIDGGRILSRIDTNNNYYSELRPSYLNIRKGTFSTRLNTVQPTADRVVTFQDASGTLAFTTLLTNAQTGTTYTIQASDIGKIIQCTNASAITVTLPSGLGAGFWCIIKQGGAGTVSVTGSGTTINNRQGFASAAGQYASFVITHDNASETYSTQGDMQ